MRLASDAAMLEASCSFQAASQVKLEVSSLVYHGISGLGLRGLGSLQTSSKVTFYLRFETTNLDYSGIHVHIVSNMAVSKLAPEPKI